MVAPPYENCDAADALSRFAAEDPSVHPRRPVTRHLEIEKDVRDGSFRRPVIINVDVPVTRDAVVPRELPVPRKVQVPGDVVRRYPAADAPLLRKRLAEWLARRQWKPSRQTQVAVAEGFARMRGEVVKRWLAWHESRAWTSTLVKPSAATLGSAALAVGLATALLVAVLAPGYSANTGDHDAPAAPDEKTSQPVATPSRPEPVTAAPLVAKRSNHGVMPYMVFASESRSPVTLEHREPRKPVLEPVAVPTRPTQPAATAAARPKAVAPTAARSTQPVTTVVARSTQAVATSGRPAPAPARVAVSSRDNAAFIGSLAIDSEPAGAMVFINQQPVGETPVRLKGLSAGSRVVRIEYPGYERWTAAVLVAAEKQAQVSARLQSVRAEQ